MADGTRMQQRRAIEADWTTSNYVLAAGELGVATDTGIIKIGNGVTAWVDLDPAFDSLYLPILGKAADSELLDGVSADFFVKFADTSTLPDPDSYVQRTSDGRVKVATATEDNDAVPLLQQTNAIISSKQESIVRTVTSATTVLLTDTSKMVNVNHASLTTQVVVTIPTNTTAAFPVGSWVDVCAIGNGGAKLTPAATVTLRGVVNVFPNYGLVRLLKIGTNEWLGIALSSQRQSRLPKIRAVRTGSTGYSSGNYIFVPYDALDTSGTPDIYNPDDEWFSIPPAGLPTARRIICKKAGEYLAVVNFISSNLTATTYTRINKMIDDNTLVGGSVIASQSMVGVGNVTARVRLVANESLGVSHATTGSFGDLADGNSSNRNDFTITRIGD